MAICPFSPASPFSPFLLVSPNKPLSLLSAILLFSFYAVWSIAPWGLITTV
jgi:hypothetical protein